MATAVLIWSSRNVSSEPNKPPEEPHYHHPPIQSLRSRAHPNALRRRFPTLGPTTSRLPRTCCSSAYHSSARPSRLPDTVRRRAGKSGHATSRGTILGITTTLSSLPQIGPKGAAPRSSERQPRSYLRKSSEFTPGSYCESSGTPPPGTLGRPFVEPGPRAPPLRTPCKGQEKPLPCHSTGHM